MSNPVNVVKQNNPYVGLGRSLGVQEIEAPRFQDNRHMSVAKLSVVGTGSLSLPPPLRPKKIFLVPISVRS
jgi:hypothetical protein